MHKGMIVVLCRSQESLNRCFCNGGPAVQGAPQAYAPAREGLKLIRLRHDINACLTRIERAQKSESQPIDAGGMGSWQPVVKRGGADTTGCIIWRGSFGAREPDHCQPCRNTRSATRRDRQNMFADGHLSRSSLRASGTVDKVSLEVGVGLPQNESFGLLSQLSLWLCRSG